MKAAHLAADLRKAQKAAASAQKEDAALAKEHAAQTAAVASSRAALAALPLDDARVAALEGLVATHGEGVRHWQRHCNEIATSLGYLINFNYADPRPGFDRSAVKGVLARLVRIQRPEHATALEVAAGGKLTHIVVDTEQTGARARFVRG